MFKNRMSDARRRLGLTQKQIAEKASIQPSSYSAYENNKKVPPVDIAIRIADALGVSLDWLCGKDEKSSNCTYGDATRSLIAAFNILVQNKTEHTTLQVKEIWAEDYDPSNTTAVVFETTTPELVDFFTKMVKFRQMSLDNLPALEMYKAWLKGELEKLDTTKVNTLPSDQQKNPDTE